MESFLRKPITVPFDSLYLDANNPRLALDEPPGYDLKRLFDPSLQSRLEAKVEEVYQVDDLVQAIIGQGWMPIDNIVVWTDPKDGDRHVVVEGNTRTVALRRIRQRLVKEQEKLKRMKEGRKHYAPHDIADQEVLIAQLQRIVDDTTNLPVLPLDADSVDELRRKLPRVLAVRHITGVKPWGNYAEDVWLLARYEHLFEDERPGERLRWDDRLIERIADEASLSSIAAKRKLKAASSFSHFKREFEGELPEDEEFASTDYYLFENIVKRPWLRQQFGLSEDALHLPSDRERTLFEWVFKHSRGRTADDNPNVFYRHENVLVWDQMQKYDEQHGTAFAKRFDVEDPTETPRMRVVEAEYVAHKARQKPTEVLDQLLQQLGKLDADTIVHEGTFLRLQVEEVKTTSEKLLKMIAAVATV